MIVKKNNKKKKEIVWRVGDYALWVDDGFKYTCCIQKRINEKEVLIELSLSSKVMEEESDNLRIVVPISTLKPIPDSYIKKYIVEDEDEDEEDEEDSCFF